MYDENGVIGQWYGVPVIALDVLNDNKTLNLNISREKVNEALEYIKAQLDYGYVDIGLHDQDELLVVEEALKTLEWFLDMRDALESYELDERPTIYIGNGAIEEDLECIYC